MKLVHFRHWECVVEKRQYRNGEPALVLNDAHTGEEIAIATVNLPDFTKRTNEVFIKDYSENAGILDALLAAGVVKATGESVQSGFARIPRCELLPPYRELTFDERLRQHAGGETLAAPKRDNGREM